MSRLSDFLFGLEGGSGIGGMPIQIVSSDTLLSPNYSYGIDTSQGGVEVTLPASPIPGDRISFFDAALTWNKNPARIHVNGNQVEQETVALTSYLLNKKAGIQELLFIGEEVGWKDASLYRTGVDPMWYGSTLQGVYPVEEFSEYTTENLLSTTTSTTYTVPEKGRYCILAAGGAGSSYASTSYMSGTSDGGSTRVMLNDAEILTALGGKRGTGPYRASRKGSIPVDLLEFLGLNPFHPNVLIKRTVSNSVSDKLIQNSIFSIPDFVVRSNSSTNDNHGESTISNGIILNLEEGDVLGITIGAGGAKGGASGNSGRGGDGRFELHIVRRVA